MFIGQNGKGRIYSHGTDRLHTVTRHRDEDGPQVFIGVSKGALKAYQAVGSYFSRTGASGIFHMHEIFLKPLS